MKKQIFLLFVILGLGIIGISAQVKTERKEAIIIELQIKLNHKIIKQKIDVALNTDLKKFGGGGFGYGAGCSHCEKSELSSYSGGYSVKSLGDEFSEIKFWIKTNIGNKKCSVKKKLKVLRKKPTEINLKCGVNLTAYYGFDLKEEN